MGVGNTQGAMYALKKMQKSNGGNGGRIITTASVAGVQVCLTVPDPTTIPTTNLICPFQSLGFFDISKAGHSIAKWGNIVMTRSFANCTPSMEAEGVKSYALAPSIVETQLARYAIYPCKKCLYS